MPDSFPGDLVLHPLSLASLVLLIVNDHFLKEHYGGPLTGKLSDIGGLVFFPVLLVSAIEVVRFAVGRRPWRLLIRGLTACVIATGSVFTLAKTWPPATTFYRLGTGVAEWPVVALLHGGGMPRLPTAHLVRDHTDLLLLPLLVIPWWLGKRRIEQIASREPTTLH
jgi:hypothetical protein